jgi:hypothetical protein
MQSAEQAYWWVAELRSNLSKARQAQRGEVMPKRQWLSEEADLFLRSDEGGRALFWYREDPALLMIEDPARAGIQIEITNLEGARDVAT